MALLLTSIGRTRKYHLSAMDRKIKKKTWTAKRIFTILGSAGIVTMILYVFVFADNSSKLNVEQDKINIASVSEGAFQEFIPVEGQVLPKITIRMDAVVGGNVRRKILEGGMEVEEGDTILELENRNLEMAYIGQQTSTNRLRNEIEIANNNLQQMLFNSRARVINLDFNIDAAQDLYSRNEILHQDSVISDKEYLDSKRNYDMLMATRVNTLKQMEFDSINTITTVRQNESRLVTSEESLIIVKGQLEDLYVTAPMTGLLGTVDAQVGQQVNQGETIALIDDLDGFKIIAPVDQHYLPRIYEGLRGTFDFAGENYALTIRKKFPEINGGTFNVEMLFDSEPPAQINRGQTISIRLQLSEERQAIMIPRGSFFQTTGGNWIFVLNEEGTEATRRNIRVGQQNTRQYEVLEGLQPGERVVTSSYDGYEDKDKLVIKK